MRKTIIALQLLNTISGRLIQIWTVTKPWKTWIDGVPSGLFLQHVAVPLHLPTWARFTGLIESWILIFWSTIPISYYSSFFGSFLFMVHFHFFSYSFFDPGTSNFNCHCCLSYPSVFLFFLCWTAFNFLYISVVHLINGNDQPNRSSFSHPSIWRCTS